MPHAHLNVCGTGELTVFIEPSEVKTITLLGSTKESYEIRRMEGEIESLRKLVLYMWEVHKQSKKFQTVFGWIGVMEEAKALGLDLEY